LRNPLDHAKALWECQAQAVEQGSLGLVRCCDATYPDRSGLPVAPLGRQQNVPALDLGEPLDQRLRRIAQTSPSLALSQCLPQNVRRETHQDVSPDTQPFLVPDRTDLPFIVIR